MKKLTQQSFVLLTLFAGQAIAFNPVQGLYGTTYIGPSYSPNLNWSNPAGQISYNIRANGGLGLGYRYNNWRFEGQGLYNSSTYKNFKTESGVVYESGSTTLPRVSGNTNTLAFMANIIFDLYGPDSSTALVPYVGVGVGYANVENNYKLYTYTQNQQYVSLYQLPLRTNKAAAQAIFGFSYMTDDFWSYTMDYRIFGTSKISELNNTSVQFQSFNIGLRFAFDCEFGN